MLITAQPSIFGGKAAIQVMVDNEEFVGMLSRILRIPLSVPSIVDVAEAHNGQDQVASPELRNFGTTHRGNQGPAMARRSRKVESYQPPRAWLFLGSFINCRPTTCGIGARYRVRKRKAWAVDSRFFLESHSCVFPDEVPE